MIQLSAVHQTLEQHSWEELVWFVLWWLQRAGCASSECCESAEDKSFMFVGIMTSFKVIKKAEIVFGTINQSQWNKAVSSPLSFVILTLSDLLLKNLPKWSPDNTKTAMSGQVGAKCSQVREQKTFIEAERRQKQRQSKHRTISGREHSSGKTRCRLTQANLQVRK